MGFEVFSFGGLENEFQNVYLKLTLENEVKMDLVETKIGIFSSCEN